MQICQLRTQCQTWQASTLPRTTWSSKLCWTLLSSPTFVPCKPVFYLRLKPCSMSLPM